MPGKADERHLVLDEQGALLLAPCPMVLLGQRHAAVEQAFVEALTCVEGRHGHEQVAPDESHLVLDGSLLVPGIWVAEGEGEAVMGGEGGEELRCPDVVADAPADARGVVEHYPGGHAADVLEYVLESLAYALRVLPGEHLGQPDVGERKGEHEVAQAAPYAHHVEIGLSEVRLRLARRPNQVQEALLADAELLLEPADIVPDGRVGDLRPLFRHQALPNALGRMALLVPALGILFQPGDYERAVLVHDARRFAPGGRARRQVGLFEILVHRVAGDF